MVFRQSGAALVVHAQGQAAFHLAMREPDDEVAVRWRDELEDVSVAAEDAVGPAAVVEERGVGFHVVGFEDVITDATLCIARSVARQKLEGYVKDRWREVEASASTVTS